MAPNRWVVNASPLIVLARIGHESLLHAGVDQTVIPRAVANEIRAGGARDRAVQALSSDAFEVVDSPPTPAGVMGWDLGPGESAVISYALAHPGWTAILDDAAARRCSRVFSVPIMGTLAVVIRARRRQLIPSAATVPFALKSGGFYLDDRLVEEVLAATVGEGLPP